MRFARVDLLEEWPSANWKIGPSSKSDVGEVCVMTDPPVCYPADKAGAWWKGYSGVDDISKGLDGGDIALGPYNKSSPYTNPTKEEFDEMRRPGTGMPASLRDKLTIPGVKLPIKKAESDVDLNYLVDQIAKEKLKREYGKQLLAGGMPDKIKTGSGALGGRSDWQLKELNKTIDNLQLKKEMELRGITPTGLTLPFPKV